LSLWLVHSESNSPDKLNRRTRFLSLWSLTASIADV
jgi:hypothetical protein